MGTIGGQYTHVYFCRLQSLKGSIQQEAMKKWNRKINTGNEPVFVDRLLDLEHNRDSILIGVIYAQLSAKPCILKDLEGDVFWNKLSSVHVNFIAWIPGLYNSFEIYRVWR